jgi:ABC-type nickel/cobalt efflux system permease component RcnA
VRLTAAALLAVAAVAALLAWWTGTHQAALWWVASRQRALQDALADGIRDVHAGRSAAFWSLIAVCAAYGFLHAVGPGHGKALVAGAALATRATALRMALIAVAGSLAQAAVAIALVCGGFALFEATARGTVEGAERWAAPVGNLAIAVIGGWLLLRGVRSLRGGRAHAGCGHHHGPDPQEVGRAGLGAALALVGAMAARPCTGALFVLVIAWRMGLAAEGAAAVLAMGLGTAAFTVAVATLAVAGRDAALLTAGGGRTALLGSWLQIAAGGLILALGGTLTLAAVAP